MGRTAPRMGPARSRKSIGLLLDRFEALGVEAVRDRDRPERTSMVTEEIKRFIAEKISDDTEAWNASTLSEAIEQEKGIRILPATLILQLKQMGLKWQRSRYVVVGQKDFEKYEEVKSAIKTLKRGL